MIAATEPDIDTNIGRYFVYQVTFQGELHDTPVGLTTGSTLIQTATIEEQHMTLNPSVPDDLADDLGDIQDASPFEAQSQELQLQHRRHALAERHADQSEPGDARRRTPGWTFGTNVYASYAELNTSMQGVAGQLAADIAKYAKVNPILAGEPATVTVTLVRARG